MALDVYIMPLWRFKAGEFESPIEKVFGMRPRIVCLDGLVKAGRSVARAPRRFRCRIEVARIRRAVSRANGCQIDWKDDGKVVYGAQEPSGFTAVRAYAMWFDHREEMPLFGPPPEDDYYAHPVWKLRETRPLRHEHLVQHDCYTDYFLPCAFDCMVRVEPFEVFGRTFHRPVGSSRRLLESLEEIAGTLGVDAGWTYDGQDPLCAVKWACIRLLAVARLSCHHGLPIIFFG